MNLHDAVTGAVAVIVTCVWAIAHVVKIPLDPVDINAAFAVILGYAFGRGTANGSVKAAEGLASAMLHNPSHQTVVVPTVGTTTVTTTDIPHAEVPKD